MLNGLPWKLTEILLSFLRLQPRIASSTSYKYAQSNIKLVTLAEDDVQNLHLFFQLLIRPHPLLLCSLLSAHFAPTK